MYYGSPRITIVYDGRDDMWVMIMDGEIMLSCSDTYVLDRAKEIGCTNLETAFKAIILDTMINQLSQCSDNALVKWFLTKTLVCGI